MFSTIAGWTLWGLLALLSVGCVLSGNRDLGVRFMMRAQGFVLALGLAATAVLPISKFHLLWILPVSFVTPMFYMFGRMERMKRRFKLLFEESQRTGVPLGELVERETGKTPD
jgi:hypothetical protein